MIVRKGAPMGFPFLLPGSVFSLGTRRSKGPPICRECFALGSVQGEDGKRRGAVPGNDQPFPWCEDCYLPELASKKVIANSYCMGIIDLLLACRCDNQVAHATRVSRFVIRAWGRLSAQTTGRSNSSGAEQKGEVVCAASSQLKQK